MTKLPRFVGDKQLTDCQCSILDKEQSVVQYVINMFNRTNTMFEYEGLPDTVPAYILELFLQMNGHVAWTEINGKLYVFCGRPGGAPDPYYRDTFYVVANPGLGISKTLKILNHLDPFQKQDTQGECVLMRNDTCMNGLLYLYSRYATELSENDVSIRSAQINSRQNTFVAANTDGEAESAQRYFADLEAGKIGVVAQQPFLDGIKAQNVSTMSSNSIIQLIELQQYLKASWYNEIGLNANFNMKREYMSTEELRASTDVLLPLIDDMLKNREEAIELVNQTYGTNITVKKNSAWEDKQKQQDVAQELSEAEVEAEEGESSE